MLRRVKHITRREESGERTVDIGLWAQGGEAGEGGVDVGVDALGIGVGLGTVAEPLLGERGHGRREEDCPDQAGIGTADGEAEEPARALSQMGNLERPSPVQWLSVS